MGIGIALGNTVDSVGPALQKGEFVGVSIPIGTSYILLLRFCYPTLETQPTNPIVLQRLVSS
jgi:ACR3 family arsenite efflux pump ArsB